MEKRNETFTLPEDAVPTYIDQMLEEAEDDFRNGRVLSKEEFFERLKKDLGLV